VECGDPLFGSECCPPPVPENLFWPILFIRSGTLNRILERQLFGETAKLSNLQHQCPATFNFYSGADPARDLCRADGISIFLTAVSSTRKGTWNSSNPFGGILVGASNFAPAAEAPPPDRGNSRPPDILPQLLPGGGNRRCDHVPASNVLRSLGKLDGNRVCMCRPGDARLW